MDTAQEDTIPSTCKTSCLMTADVPTYVAIRILVASETDKNRGFESKYGKDVDNSPGWEHLCFPLRRFETSSPNGTHVCLVYPVLGPTVDNAERIFQDEEKSSDILRHISQQTVQALATLHTSRICHADFRPSNILLELNCLDGLGEEEVMSLLGEPETTEIYIRKDSHPTPEVPYAPKYLVYPVEFEDSECLANPPRIRIIDFGQAFQIDESPQPPAFGIPANYAAPEVIMENSGGIEMDLWSLGCTLFEIRLGRRLFDVFQSIGLSEVEYILEVALLLGRLPVEWAKFYKPRPGTEAEYEVTEADRESARRFYDRIKGMPSSAGQAQAHSPQPLVSDAEAEIFADLLGRLLRYEKGGRLSAMEVVKHAWFGPST
ncbi:Protein kinase-like domain protein [Niveomyces insectorum RCEF 264]|uniref:EKC/KEOPS complex subunit BUD32 n=1 Tax=Niveomyces insectorum RCEF 264 TaxID=1081102 RepID=A0A167W8R6_9HYPO|nr:Protein kinase-like domain protein [Niveomyces insectorum RCEF 264]